MDIAIGVALTIAGLAALARAVVVRRPKPAYHYFAKTSQEYHDLQRNKRKENGLRCY